MIFSFLSLCSQFIEEVSFLFFLLIIINYVIIIILIIIYTCAIFCEWQKWFVLLWLSLHFLKNLLWRLYGPFSQFVIIEMTISHWRAYCCPGLWSNDVSLHTTVMFSVTVIVNMENADWGVNGTIRKSSNNPAAEKIVKS